LPSKMMGMSHTAKQAMYLKRELVQLEAELARKNHAIAELHRQIREGYEECERLAREIRAEWVYGTWCDTFEAEHPDLVGQRAQIRVLLEEPALGGLPNTPQGRQILADAYRERSRD
jgi:hypothetical protein